MADSAFIQGLQITQAMNYLTAAGGTLVVYDQNRSCMGGYFQLDDDVEIDREMNIEESTVELYDRLILYRPLLRIAIFNRKRSLMRLYELELLGFSTVTRVTGPWNPNSYVNVLLAVNWAVNIFILTMQAILVIRVYALFNRSKKVLVFLATSYILQAIATFVMTGLVANKRMIEEIYISVGPTIGNVVEVVDINFSAFYLTSNLDSILLSIVFDIILLLFVLWAFVIHALEAKTLDGGWSLNVLVKTLVADHLLYFLCNLIWLSLCIATDYSTEPNLLDALANTMYHVFSALVVVAGPRMVISLRTTENKTRGEGATLEGEVSTIRFGVREPPAQSESAMEEGGGFRAADENAQIE
ncbi:hypothetical protein BJ138DRAFT_1236717 [Hygrophoropsis aurantiaca]|uniref:Uncharacterized protein n=1 Tax=Hygrophoropsis aurantiaca TaxID=72124 RepID=A0ACB7ZV36_9AGAM|nr:hypothetical protein BJ138DRAFT_1236717 [Hygrophoropsis aurantiaca]